MKELTVSPSRGYELSIDLATFNCDGVPVDSEASYIDAEIAFSKKAGLHLDHVAYGLDFIDLAPED